MSLNFIDPPYDPLSEFTEGKLQEIHDDLQRFKIADNPLDLMITYAIDLLRDVIFYTVRVRNSKIPSTIIPSFEDLEKKFDNLRAEMTDVCDDSAMQDITVRFLQKFSVFSDPELFNEVNNYLFALMNQIPTVYTRSIPNRPIQYEKVRLGMESPAYKRLVELRYLITEMHWDENPPAETHTHIGKCIDILNNGRKCIEYGWISKEGYEKAEAFIKERGLTEADLRYIEAVLFGC